MLRSYPNRDFIDFRGPIGSAFVEGVSEEHLVDALDEMDGRDIRLRMDSPGGVGRVGLSMLAILEGYEGQVTIEVVMAASAASFVILAGDDVQMASDRAEVMVHNPFMHSVQGDAAALREIADSLDELAEHIAVIYEAGTDQPKAFWLDKMNEETFFRGQEAVDVGFAGSVMESRKKRARSSVDERVMAMIAKRRIVADLTSRSV